MADIWGPIQQFAQNWTYGPVEMRNQRLAEEKAKRSGAESEADIDLKKAQADYYRQGGSRRTAQTGQGSLTSPQAQVLQELTRQHNLKNINTAQYNKAWREITGRDTDLIDESLKTVKPVTPPPAAPVVPPTWRDRLFGSRQTPTTSQTPSAATVPPSKEEPWRDFFLGPRPTPTTSSTFGTTPPGGALGGLTPMPSDMQQRFANVGAVGISPMNVTPQGLGLANLAPGRGALGGLATLAQISSAPTTQEEFERNVTGLARKDRQKAKDYYDQYASMFNE